MERNTTVIKGKIGTKGLVQNDRKRLMYFVYFSHNFIRISGIKSNARCNDGRIQYRNFTPSLRLKRWIEVKIASYNYSEAFDEFINVEDISYD
jgi:hypothetical protein